MSVDDTDTYMGVRELFVSRLGGGTQQDQDLTIHIECRTCGSNLTVDSKSCPACGGKPVRYEFDA